MVIDGVVGVDSAPALSAGAGMDAEVAAPGTGIARGGAAAAVRGGGTVPLRAGNTAAGESAIGATAGPEPCGDTEGMTG